MCGCVGCKRQKEVGISWSLPNSMQSRTRQAINGGDGKAESLVRVGER